MNRSAFRRDTAARSASLWRSKLPKALTLLLFAVGFLLASTPGAQASSAIDMRATLGGRPATSIDDNNPLRLQTDQTIPVNVVVSNHTHNPVVVHSVRLEGKVIGLTFFSYETVVDMRVPAGGTAAQSLSLDLVDLSHQASGLLPARIELLSTNRSVMATQSFPVHVLGGGWSVYALFSLAVALLTAVGLARTLWLLATHRLDDNRWKRGLRFCAVGVGVGLTLTFSLSAAAALVPSARDWLGFVVICGALFFVLGEITPRRTASGGAEPQEDDPDGRASATLPMTDTRARRLTTLEAVGPRPSNSDPAAPHHSA
jgi:hypothetical protein